MFIGIDVGGTKTAFALADEAGRFLAKIQAPSGLYERTWRNVLVSGVEKITYDNGIPIDKILRIGVGTPDLIIKSTTSETTLREAIKTVLEEKFKIPVTIANDAHTAALGEYARGAAQGLKNFLFVILGTGVGGAVMKNGQLDPKLGEFGHIQVDPNGPQCGCGKKGCLHHYISGQALAGRAIKLIAEKKATDSKILKLVGPVSNPKELIKKITAETVFEAARQEDPIAQQVISEGLRYLAKVLKDLFQQYKPELIVIGGGISHVDDLIITPLKQLMADSGVKKAKIVPAALGSDAGLIGALTLALTG